MKIIIAGAWTDWLGLHLRHFADGFRQCGAEVAAADYHKMSRFMGINLPGAMAQEQRDRSLEKIIRKHRPDMVLFASSCKFDVGRLRSYFRGTAVIYDYDGPRRRTPEEFLRYKENSVAILTVSQYWKRMLAEINIDSVYLPHGTDTSYYAPANEAEYDDPFFAAPVSYIGRATGRRVAICRAANIPGLALYGDRWSSHPDGKALKNAGNIRLDRNVNGRELVSIYRRSNVMINILQEPLNDFRTILSLQCFAIPAAGTCLAAEYVEEAEACFEPGKEILLFRTPEELRELVMRCIREPEYARAVGEAGRKRCIACHTHRHRAQAVIRNFL